MDNLKFCTLTNFGYRFYTDNLLKSLKLLNIDSLLDIHCADEKGYEYFKKNYPKNNVFNFNTKFDKKLV